VIVAEFCSGRRAFDDFDFVWRQFVKLVNQLVDLAIGRIDRTTAERGLVAQ
jgi:hypothetical protein